MNNTILRIDLRSVNGEERRRVLNREWLATNGLGGYASGTISGSVTWRYHGLLVAALPAPLGRTVMLNHLAECLHIDDGRTIYLGGHDQEILGQEESGGYLAEFRVENGLPIWRYEFEGIVLEKHLLFLYGQNTVHVNYHLVSPREDLRLELRPSLHFRGHEEGVDARPNEDYTITVKSGLFEILGSIAFPRLRMVLKGESPAFAHHGGSRREVVYQKDAERGHNARGSLWTPGHFSVTLNSRVDATLVASTEEWHRVLALEPREALGFHQHRHARLVAAAAPELRESPAADLVLAADQFIITPAGRLRDAARAHAAGDDIRTVIAGYHWFTDWGRDTMISLEGLTLTTGRHAEAGWILRTFAHYIRNGLIPNMFPEHENQGLYHTADATLWFFHALDRYLQLTGDSETLRLILPKLIDIARFHMKGTSFGISMDEHDGLLRQGAEGYQLTWMDAKVEGWVVTPRRGKAVEINGLWYNALRLLEHWVAEERGPGDAAQFGEVAVKARESFNQRFWYAEGGYLYDVVDGEDGDDIACRPNQLFSYSLRHPVLDKTKWEPVLEVVRQRLLTPLGLRTLSRDHADYKTKYFGDLRARDAAYHQGTVWAWLIGPFIDCWLKVHPGDKAGGRKFLDGFAAHLNEGCVGSINEVFDAEAPFTPRGCIAQAWSVAEVLRAWAKTAPAGNEDQKTGKKK